MTSIPLSLYVHFPWCVSKCPYCDFNSHAMEDTLPEAVYVDALLKDLDTQLANSIGRAISTVFIGGGTPSLVSADQIGRLMGALWRSGRLLKNAEVTLEANPGALDSAHFAAYREAGINRLSIGVQSFNNHSLQKIGRIHNADQAIQAVRKAQQLGFELINIDLMFGLPGQSLAMARDDLAQAIALDVSHISLYQLTIEANTRFAVNTPPLPDIEQCWEMQEQLQEILIASGFSQYEVSAYSRHAPCQHNLNYWQYGDYLAIGAGAHGKLSHSSDGGELAIERHWNHRHPQDYIKAIETGVFTGGKNVVDDSVFEFLMNGLRLKSGFSLRDYQVRTSGEVEGLHTKLQPFFRKNWLTREGDVIRATNHGFRFLDSMLLECL